MSTTRNNPNDWNSQIIAEFRANGGQVGGNFAGAPLLLLHSIGAKSGNERINPMMYQELGNGSVAVFASNAGADVHPAWYYNVVANPDVTAEIGETTRPFQTRTAAGAERTAIWERQKVSYPGFADYEVRTEREIPVVILDPA